MNTAACTIGTINSNYKAGDRLTQTTPPQNIDARQHPPWPHYNNTTRLFSQLQQTSVKYVVRRGQCMRHFEDHVMAEHQLLAHHVRGLLGRCYWLAVSVSVIAQGISYPWCSTMQKNKTLKICESEEKHWRTSDDFSGTAAVSLHSCALSPTILMKCCCNRQSWRSIRPYVCRTTE